MTPTTSVRRPVRIVLVLVLLVAAAAVFVVLRNAPSTTTPAATTGSGLTIVWHDGSNELEVTAIGYRKKTVAKVRIGSEAWQEVRADDNGTVHVTLAMGPAAGRAGTSVLISGRSAGTGSRTLVGGLPPAASAHGPSDVMPWAVAGLLVAMALFAGFGHRPRRGVHRVRSPRFPAPITV